MSRWATGWVVLPGTTKTPGEHLHRPHPESALASLCDRVIKGKPVLPMQARLPQGIPRCSRCERRAARGRLADQRAAQRAEKAKERQERELLEARREKYGGYRPGSVRAVGAGLPGLGRRR